MTPDEQAEIGAASSAAIEDFLFRTARCDRCHGLGEVYQVDRSVKLPAIALRRVPCPHCRPQFGPPVGR